MLTESNNQEWTCSEADQSNGITVIEQKFSNLGLGINNWEQQKSILITKDMVNTSSKMPSCTAGKQQVPCQYCSSADH